MSSAIMSPCGTYRYALSRNLETPRLFNAVTQRCLFVMLNPSTADASTDDATIRRCKAYASSWSYHVLDVVNLFALRSTDPTALREHTDPVGPDNDSHIRTPPPGRSNSVSGDIHQRVRNVFLDLLSMLGTSPYDVPAATHVLAHQLLRRVILDGQDAVLVVEHARSEALREASVIRLVGQQKRFWLQRAIVTWVGEKDGGYRADTLGQKRAPYLSAYGSTPRKAIEQLGAAIDTWWDEEGEDDNEAP
jgi:hypothetical protein